MKQDYILQHSRCISSCLYAFAARKQAAKALRYKESLIEIVRDGEAGNREKLGFGLKVGRNYSNIYN